MRARSGLGVRAGAYARARDNHRRKHEERHEQLLGRALEGLGEQRGRLEVAAELEQPDGAPCLHNGELDAQYGLDEEGERGEAVQPNKGVQKGPAERYVACDTQHGFRGEELPREGANCGEPVKCTRARRGQSEWGHATANER